MKNYKPRYCTDCAFDRACSSGMYLDGCRFYPPEDKPKSLTTILKEIFTKIFH